MGSQMDSVHVYDGDVACGDGLIRVLGDDAFGEGWHKVNGNW